LGEENQLFKDAAEATRNGDVKGALSGLDKLLVEHPRSPLAQTALVRKFRLLAKAGQADAARREAERYLAAYPTGFAVSEAQALVQGQTPLRASPSPAEQQGTP
jgi:outer membrane protein assembly factor BamD (BamD/ComL family)